MGLPYYGAGSQDLATAKAGSCCEADESRHEASEASSEGSPPRAGFALVGVRYKRHEGAEGGGVLAVEVDGSGERALLPGG